MKKKLIIASSVVLVLAVLLWLIFSVDIFNLKTATDLQTVKNFDSIQTEIIDYFKTNGKLPEKLTDLANLPATYDYEAQSQTNFKLCADFKSDVSQEIVDKAPIRVDYKQGYDCVVFNISDSVGDVAGQPTIVKKDANLVKLSKDISTSSSSGVSAGSINIKFDASKSYFYKNDSDGNYFLNLYTTIGTSKDCKTSLNPESGCCYTLNEISLGSSDKTATFNRLGSSDYINPFPKGAQDTFGDLPINFCFQGNKEFSGGVSFSIPQSMINFSSTSNLTFKHTNNGETSGDLTITIK